MCLYKLLFDRLESELASDKIPILKVKLGFEKTSHDILKSHVQHPTPTPPLPTLATQSEVLALQTAHICTQHMEVQVHTHQTRNSTAAIYITQPAASSLHRNPTVAANCHSGLRQLQGTFIKLGPPAAPPEELKRERRSS